MRSALGARTLNAALWLAIVALFVVNVVLFRQNQHLKTTFAFPEGVVVQRDQLLKDLGGVGLDGRFRAIPMPTSPNEHLLLFTFSPVCSQCQLEEPLVVQINQEAQKLGWKTLWISRGSPDATRDFARAHNIPDSDFLVEIPHGTYLKLGMQAVPQLIAISNGGQVEQTWLGSLSQQTAAEVSKYLNAHVSASASTMPPVVVSAKAPAPQPSTH
jgi:peroxiredoxin